MTFFTASTNIKATPETIWAIITDAPHYPDWDPGVIRIDGDIAAGEKITAHAKISPNRAFPVKVVEFVPNQKMVWSSGMPLGLFKGERTFNLNPKGDGTIDFVLREEFTGLLAPMITKSIPDLTETFENFVAGLKAHAEAREATA